MIFQNSGLLNDELVERAFDYAQAYTQSLTTEMQMDYRQAISESYSLEFDLLALDLKNELLSPEEYEEEKAFLEKQRDKELNALRPETIITKLEAMLRKDAVGAAQEIQKHSDKASPVLIAAALLAQCARSPLDCKKIEKEFGEAVAEMVAVILDVDAYPAARKEKTAAASDDTRRVLMAELINSFRYAAEHKDAPGFKPEEVEQSFSRAALLWNVDKKLDERLVAVFNQAAQVRSAPYTMEISEKGVLQLIGGTLAQKAPAKPPLKKPNNLYGDDGF